MFRSSSSFGIMKLLVLAIMMSSGMVYGITVYFIPGLGVDSRVFSYLDIDSTVNQVYLEWPICSESETMESYADKFIAQMDTSKEIYVVGLSLGGMVAIEIAHKCRNVDCILISSAVCKDELPPRYEVFRYIPIYSFIKDYHLKISGYVLSRFLALPEDVADLYVNMLTDYSAHLFRRQTEMLLNWNRLQCDVPVLRLHGARDPIIPIKNIKTKDYHLVMDGTHKMVVTHAKQISAQLNNYLHR